MTIALIKSGTIANAANPAFGQATASGSLLVCWLFSNNGSATFADSIAGTGWTLAAPGGAAFAWSSVWYKKNSSAGETAPTVSAGANWSALLAEFGGADTVSPLDSSGGSTGTGSSAQTATNTAADSAAGELIVFSAGWNSSNTGGTISNTMADSSGSSVTPTAVSGVSGTTFYYDFSWGIAGSVGASKDTSTGTLSVFSGGAAAIASFKVGGTDSSAGHAASASDLGGGSGTWASTGNADGAPDAAYATWTAP